MTTGTKSLTTLSSVVVASLLTWWSQASPAENRPFAFSQLWSWMKVRSHMPLLAPPDTTRPVPGDTVRYRPSRRPRVAPQDRSGNFLTDRQRRSPLILPLPSNVKPQVTLGDSLDYVDVEENVGQDIDYRDPARLSYSEFQKLQEQQAIRNYFRNKAEGGVAGGPGNATAAKRLIPKIYMAPTLGRIFGGEYIDIRPNGSATFSLGWRQNFNDNPSLTLRQRRNGDFNFQQNFNLNLSGQIGDKLKILFNYDTRAAFDFENQIKADFTGYDTDIIRKVEMGNVSLPLNNSLVQGGQNLFGVKTQMQFGRLSVTSVAAQLRGTADEVRVQNGAQSRNFEIKASQYEANRHFFLSQFFRDRYNSVLRNLPTVQSGVSVQRLEVYITNDNRTTETLRNVVALQDIGEPLRTYRKRFFTSGSRLTPTDNKANSLYSRVTAPGAPRDAQAVDNFLQTNADLQLVKTVDYERVRARKLDPREYTFNPQLGYLSLNTPLLPEQVLAVSFQYTFNGDTHNVGELAQENYQNVPDEGAIYLKLLRATGPGTGLVDANDQSVNLPAFAPPGSPGNDRLLTGNLPVFDLMMKNIYALNASQLSRDQFRLDVIYKDDATGVDIISLKEGQNVANRPLTQVLNLDNVNPNNDRPADGNFDFLPGLTIDPELGKIIFPVVEPFGAYLQQQFTPAEDALVTKYVYPELYVQVQSDAQQRQEKDKFYLKGRYSATATDEITLPGIRIPEGSVRVYSGSTLLTEGQDYQVFYDQAKVKILNASYLNSANELRVSFERDAVVQVLPRKLLGTRLDYKVSDDLNFGGTLMHLIENQAPGINRVNLGDEPSNNTIYGLDMSLRRESRVLTKYIDALPFVNTKAPSSVAFSAEFAQLVPGRSQLGRGENGVSYLDDFENSRTPYTLGNNNTTNAWRVATTPLRIIDEQSLPTQTLGIAYPRARLAWYTIDPTYFTNGSNKPSNISTEDLRFHYTRPVPPSEVFPNRDNGALGQNYLNTFDLAYFPHDRGQYNYNPNVSADGRRLNPNNPALNRRNYGGISREITFDTDFDNANVEYLEFWLMDPFISSAKGYNRIIDSENPSVAADSTTAGGELYFNLGTISEDLLKDGTYEFENGLPDSDDPAQQQSVTQTIWGRATRLQFLTDAFSNAPGGRDRQDIGLDGYSSQDEKAFFSGIYQTIDDPSADDFRHHLDPAYDQRNAKILGRYKYYNGMEGNSRATSGLLSSTAAPDKEDLNRDNVINDTERYYEYRIPLQRGGLVVGQNYIVDKVTNPVYGDEVSWYLFRIPIRQYTGIRGAQAEFGFKSMRFLRMYMTGWQQSTVLRFVQMQFVANQWRRYLSVISDPNGQQCINCTTDANGFAISTVGVEENGAVAGQGGAIPYVSPPGIQRDKEYGSTTTLRQQNEQSLRLCVDGLQDGYAKAAYKNVSLNLLRYKRLKMFLHAESENRNLRDGQVVGFVRFGTDYTQNYYEYSVPLEITQQGSTTADAIWPEANRIDVPLQAFVDAKAARAQAPGANLLVPFTIDYPVTLSNGRVVQAHITVVGQPDLSALQGLMIGVLNPSDQGQGPDYSLCLWADELRVKDFDQTSGWAATARFNTRLADVANITATGAFTSVGFGSLQDRPSQRSLDNIARGDVNAAVAAEKFLPEKLGLRVPVLLQAGHEIRSPKYDPLDPDMTLAQSLQSKFTDEGQKANYRREVTDQTRSKSISLLNVRKERTNPDRKPKPYDVENLAVSYSLTERLHTDIQTDRDFTRTYTGALAYTYQPTVKPLEPLSKVKVFESPYLKFLKEVNFTPLPSRFAFRADLDRRYNERFLQRTQAQGQVPSTDGIPGVFQKSFFVNRIYDLKWDLTRSLIFDYTATNRSSVDEGLGTTIGNSQVAQENRDLIKKNLRQGGRTTNFNQTVALTYRLPLDKFPLTDWLSADARYAANYSWQAASTAIRAPAPGATLEDTATVRVRLGNTIQNSRDISVNGRIDLVKLYNKVKFLNIINNAPVGGEKGKSDAAGAGVSTMERLRRGSEAAGTKSDQKTDNAAKDSTKTPELRVLKAVLRSLMTARSLNFTYTQTAGTLLPGYLPKTRFFGLDSSFTAPGLPFILGQQYDLQQLYDRANGRGWYTNRSDLLNTPLSSLYTQNLQVRTSLEPIRDFSIQLEARQQKVKNRETFYRRAVNPETLQPLPDGTLANQIPTGSGSFSTTFIAVNTLFGDLRKNNTSAAFDRFVENRRAVRNRLQQDNLGNGGIYGYNSQEVLIPSFLDAYRGKSSSGSSTKESSPFGVLPLPNWTVQYNGLTNLPFVQQYFRSVSLRHSYAADYQVQGYTTSTEYGSEPQGPSYVVNDQRLYVPYYVINQVTVSERLSPLVGVNFQTLQKINGTVDYGLDRALALNTTNAQITELRNKTLTIGFGYTTNRFRVPFRIGGEQKILRNELNMRLDLSIRDNITIQRSIADVVVPDSQDANAGKIGTPTQQVTNGNRQVQLRPTIDYVLNQRLNLQFFFTRNISQPRGQVNSFKNATTEGGIQLRYSLSQ